MCIIAVKKKGQNNIPLDILKKCYNSNPDGAGIMYNYNNKVIISKGYMDWNDFEKRYKKIEKILGRNIKNVGIVYHFRISTTGKVNKEQTHPFPISNKDKRLKKLYSINDIGVAHNGILYEYNTDTILSDSQLFTKEVLYQFYKHDKQFYKKKNINKIIEQLLSRDKLAILDKDGNIKLYGDFIEDNGYYYSNSTYTYSSNYSSNYSYNYSDTYSDKTYKDYYSDYNYSSNAKKESKYFEETLVSIDPIYQYIKLQDGTILQGMELENIFIDDYNYIYEVYEDKSGELIYSYIGKGEVLDYIDYLDELSLSEV